MSLDTDNEMIGIMRTATAMAVVLVLAAAYGIYHLVPFLLRAAQWLTQAIS